jgi:hypothetical protein
MMQPAARGFGPPPLQKLQVFDVGRYEASFVPTAADFSRLDPRFRLPHGFLEALPAYADYGFAIFRLKPKKGLLGGSKKQSVHPMALSFPRREPRALFFPTVHVHDGSVPQQAAFDHALYCQADGVLEATLSWQRSHGPLGAHVQPGTPDVVDAERAGFALPLMGTLDNADVWLREPRGVALSDLSGSGECYAYEINVTAAYAFGWNQEPHRTWAKTAEQRLDRLCKGLREGLVELTSSLRSTWRLTPLSDALPPHFMNGQQLWSGTSYMDGKPATTSGPGRVHFRPFSKLVEPQDVTLGFAQLPDQDEVSAINAELSRLLDRAIA